MIDASFDPALSRLSSSLTGLLTLKAVMGGLCARRLPAALRLSKLPPLRGRTWTRTDLTAAERTLLRLGFTGPSGRCRRPLEHELAKRGGLLRPFVLQALEAESGPGAQADSLDLRLRLAVYSGDVATLPHIHEAFKTLRTEWEVHERGPFLRVLRGGGFTDLPADAIWAAQLPAPLARVVLDDCLAPLLERGEVAPILSVLPTEPSRLFADLTEASYAQLLFLALRGHLTEAERLSPASGDEGEALGLQIRGLCAFFRGRVAEAMGMLRQARKRLRPGRGKIGLERIPALCLIAGLVASAKPENMQEARTLLECPDAAVRLGAKGLAAVQGLFYLALGREEQAAAVLREGPETGGEPFSRLLVLVGRSLCGRGGKDVLKGPALELLPLVGRLAAVVQGAAPEGAAARLTEDELIDLSGLLVRRENWEHRLEDVIRLLEPTPQRSKRLIWLLHPDTGELEPLEQSGGPRGWSAGRPASLKRLCEQAVKLNWLSEQDRRILACARWFHVWHGIRCVLDPVSALCAAVGHPLLFRAQDRQPVTLVRADVELVVSSQGGGLRLDLSRRSKAAAKPDQKGAAEEDANVPDLSRCGDRAYCVHVWPPRCAELEAALGPDGLTVPGAGVPKVLDLVRHHNPDLPVRLEADTALLEGDWRPVLQLRPAGEGLAAEAVVRPLGPDGPFRAPGRGEAELLSGADGSLTLVRRDFAAELRALDALLEACPLLAAAPHGPEGNWGGQRGPWLFPKLESALDLLLALRSCTAPLSLEWPEGRSLHPRPPMASNALSLQTEGLGETFRLRGWTAGGPDLPTLLAGLKKSRGNYIPLGEGEFLTLTDRFRDLLERLAVLTQEERDGSRSFHRLAAPVLAGVLEQAGLAESPPGAELLAAVREAATLEPIPPSGLLAELRSYQQEGFAWLFRLARWAGGACLADDMGLGKTLQATALLLAEAEAGPSLVTAPLSVCHNWERELGRFAPGLRVHRPGSSAAGRRRLAVSLEAGDVLVISYGLLRAEPELSGREWNVAVFDEAQALKNPTTQRTKAGRGLRARFRLALTGTPVENRLEELWSLFEVILPGLLGSLPSFRRRFLRSAEDGGTALAALKDLTRPFILRRTKTAVLNELPPRTEQTLEVELPPEERTFYEGLRQQAIAELQAQQEVPAGHRRLAILAWLTKLRRACCHPSLADPRSLLPGAKLATLLDLVLELRRGGHRALIFSQFTGHLALARPALEKAELSCLYLDGSTPEKERAKAVAAFQAGEGDVFLISLRAGGQGLNLTAADYVIHLDPWWNPAVEDQASDRAHRLGQERPVTIYRLVVRDSVEENILRLHTAKRRLAADFLEGADAVLSEEELLALLGA